jgi:CheY-like chemotaxis protein
MATISGYLKARNHSILQACNGHDAIAQAQAAPPDIILMDIQMPDMDGLEAIRQIRKISELAVVPIIAITDLAQPDDRYRCLEAGADRYLSKPLKLKLLATTIQELLSPSSPSPNLQQFSF